MWQNIIIAVIVFLCALFVGRRLFRQMQGQSGCGCDCSGCAPPGGPGKEPGAPADQCDCGEKR
ncbi:MAG: FeoB-associated Cys-rich membrane protein [Deltaproteobacteria bacterium]